jgi:hypothetical protein
MAQSRAIGPIHGTATNHNSELSLVRAVESLATVSFDGHDVSRRDDVECFFPILREERVGVIESRLLDGGPHALARVSFARLYDGTPINAGYGTSMYCAFIANCLRKGVAVECDPRQLTSAALGIWTKLTKAGVAEEVRPAQRIVGSRPARYSALFRVAISEKN